MSDLLKNVYRIFTPSPLHPGQQELYVNLDDVRGKTGIVQRMAQKIRLSGQPTCQILTGHRGSGKSTELWQLRHALQDSDADNTRYFVVQVQADDQLDRNDIDFPDVLIAIVRQLSAQLRDRAGIELKPGYFRDRLDRLKNLSLSDISFDGLQLDAGLAQLSARIKTSPDAREEIRKALEPDTDNWLRAANDVIGEAVQELRKKDFCGLVVIVDDLDKMITRPHPAAGCSTTEYLFVHRSAQLTAFACHLVYTLPIELAYSHHEKTISQLYGGHLPVVPMTKITTPPPKSRTYSAGMKKFREMVNARLKQIHATEQDLFQSDRVRNDLIKLTGGQPTELMTMIREAAVTDGLPIGTAGVKRCRTEAMRSYRRQLRTDHWPLIEEVRRTGQVVRTKDNELAFRQLLDSRALLLYMNDEEWYDVNPAIDDLEPPLPPSVDQAVGDA